MTRQNEAIIRDLMTKVGDDVIAAMRRTLAIAPKPHLPITLAAGASLIAFIALQLDTDPKAEPDPDCVLLAGLLLARTGIGGDGIGDAYKDFAILKAAGRTAAH